MAAPGDCRVLVLHDRPENFREPLAARFPDLTIDYATSGEAVPT